MNPKVFLLGWVTRIAGSFLVLELVAHGDHTLAWSLLAGYYILAFGGRLDLWPGFRVDLLHRRRPEADHLRGGLMLTAGALRRVIRQRRLDSILVLGGVPIPNELEVQNLLLAGAPGSGKSVAIATALDSLRRRGDQLVVADIGGYYTGRLLHPDDVILSPLDVRAVAWSPLAEMESPWDAETLARSLVPEEHGDHGDWRHYARVVLGSVLQRLWTDGGNNGQLQHLACNASMEELRKAVAGLPAEALCAAENAKMFANIHGILASHAGSLKYLHPDAGRDGFSLRRWVREGGTGAAFWNVREDQLALLRPLIAAMLDAVAVEVLSLPPSRDRRLWLVLDELHSYGRIGSLETFLTKGRKAGGCAIVGLQSLSQLRSVYGEHGAQTLLNCLGTWLVLRSADAETAEYLSRALGEAELRRIVGTGGSSDTGTHDGWQEQVVRDRLVMASELQRLPKLCGYLALAGDFPIAPIKLALPKDPPAVPEAFVPRPLPNPAIQEPAAPSRKSLPPSSERFAL